MCFYLKEAPPKLAVLLAHPCSLVRQSGQTGHCRADGVEWVYSLSLLWAALWHWNNALWWDNSARVALLKEFHLVCIIKHLRKCARAVMLRREVPVSNFVAGLVASLRSASPRSASPVEGNWHVKHSLWELNHLQPSLQTSMVANSLTRVKRNGTSKFHQQNLSKDLAGKLS